MNLDGIFGDDPNNKKREEVVQRFMKLLNTTAENLKSSDPAGALFKGDSGANWLSEEISTIHEAMDDRDTVTGEEIARLSALYFLLLITA